MTSKREDRSPTKCPILVIEDNEQNLYLVIYLLEKAGHQVVAARNGIEGIEKALAVRPALILLDIQLPGMDGYAVAAELRNLDSMDSVPIVAVTSYAMPGDEQQAVAAGCTGYIEKPIDPERFVDQIRTYLPGGTP